MVRKRSRKEIAYDMLLIIHEKRGKMKPTHLMYKANLSHQQMNNYLSELIDNNLVEKTLEDKRQVISMTKKGDEFLQRYNQLKEFEDTFGL